MELNDQIMETLVDAEIIKVRVGLRWTAVVTARNGKEQCGLASTLTTKHKHSSDPDIPRAGQLEEMTGLELAKWIHSEVPLRRSLGCAAMNSLVEHDPDRWVKDNASEAILRRGKNKKVVLIGHFPFVKDLRERLEDFHVLDLNPTGEDLPARAAPDLLPEADVAAITGMTFINGTLGKLLAMCREDAYVIILGPTTPLSPVLHEHGVNLLAGSVVKDIPAVLNALTQGANFRQIHRAGVQLVLQRSGV